MAVKGIGVDIVEIPRMDRALDRWGERFTGKVFTGTEMDYARRSRRPSLHLSARFAGKEAVAKALGTGFGGDCRMKEIEIVNDNRGRPSVRLHGAARRFAAAKGIREVFLSLSHSAVNAVAQAVAVGAAQDEED